MQTKTGIKFSEIEKLFPLDHWDVGILTQDQLKICAYSPIKVKAQEYGSDYTNNIHYFSIVNSIVLIRQSPSSWDYSLYEEADKILKNSKLQDWFPIYTNFKVAAILSGLGVRAKNSLVYSYKFGFDSKICVIGFDNEILECPTNREINLKYWERCNGCSDCRLACPVEAIHNEVEPFWLDSGKCDNFMGFGDHPKIPSIKKFWHKNVHPEVSQDTIDNMKSCLDFDMGLAFDANGYTLDIQTGIYKDGKLVPVPFCRECQVQPRCSKWGGDYPYESA
ncbi:MAG: 4Fe-4S binding protein [Spirochaetota bacterium]|nr:4Fe-4S binding protein [Spirochaetota bacterium]